MIEQICAFIHNYFDRDRSGRYWHRESGEFTIEGGSITLPFLVDGQYFRIVGSRLNDGVYQYPADDLEDETFTGDVYEMRVPKGFRDIAGEIEDWFDQYGEVMQSPYQSEDVIGVYSYTKASAGSNGGGDSQADWRAVFGNRLNEWRKIS